jgi:hypothetical protein
MQIDFPTQFKPYLSEHCSEVGTALRYNSSSQQCSAITFPCIQLNTKLSACCSIASDIAPTSVVLCVPRFPHWNLHADANYEAISFTTIYQCHSLKPVNMQMKIQLTVSFLRLKILCKCMAQYLLACFQH